MKNKGKISSQELIDYLECVFQECLKMNKKELIKKCIVLEHALIVANKQM